MGIKRKVDNIQYIYIQYLQFSICLVVYANVYISHKMHYRTDPKCAPPPLSTIRTVKHSHINSLSRCHTPASPPGLILLGSVQLTHALTPSHSLNHSVTHSSPARSRHPPPLRLGAQGQVRPRARPTLRSRRYANLCMQIRVPLSVSSSASAPCVLAGSSPVCTEAREQA